MLILALLATAVAADDFRIEPCRHPFEVDIDISEPLFEGGRRAELDSCGSGIATPFREHADGTGKQTASVAIESLDGERVRIVIDDIDRGIRLEHGDIALDSPTEFEVDSKGRRLSARVVVRKRAPHSGNVSAYVVNKPANEVAEHLQAVSGWTVRGLDLLGTNRVTFKFDMIPTRSMLVLLADVGDATVTDISDHAVEMRRKRKR